MKATTLTKDTLPEAFGNKWGWFIVIGVILLCLGFFALIYQFFATVFSVYYIAFLLIFAGITQVVHSFQIKGLDQTALWAIMGILYIVTGVVAIYNPILASSALTLMMAILLLVGGTVQIMGALHNRHIPQWGWLLCSGIITFILGLLIVVEWPSNSVWVLGLFLGLDLIFQGWAYISIGIALKSTQRLMSH
jgi:uncharacterized membrane protein HdeD (DUF308 family)